MKVQRKKLREERLYSATLLYTGILFICFAGSWFLAGDYHLMARCDGKWHFFEKDETCELIIPVLLVQMDAETIDPRVSPYLPPGSYTPGIGRHLLGTDALGRDVFAGLLYGGQRSILIGFAAGMLSVLLGWAIGLWTVFVNYLPSFSWHYFAGMAVISLLALITEIWMLLLIPLGMLIWYFLMRSGLPARVVTGKSWWWSRGLEWYQALPDLLLLMLLSVSIGIQHPGVLILIIVAVVWPSVAVLARRTGSEVTGSEYFQQALRNGIGKRIMWYDYLWANTRSYVWALLPLIIARVILLEATLSFLGLGLPPDVVTIGSMIGDARNHTEAWWLIVSGASFIFILVFPLLNIGKILK